MSNTIDTGGFFSKIFGFFFGSIGSKDITDRSAADDHHGQNDHGQSDAKLKLVVSHEEANLTGKLPTPTVLASPPQGFEKDYGSDSPFHLSEEARDFHNMSHENITGYANQNTESFFDTLPAFTDANFSNINGSNDDVLNNTLGVVVDSNYDIGKILSAETIPSFVLPQQTTVVANDAGHSVVLDATDILGMGNNLIITGSELDSVSFQDEGWTRINFDDDHPKGIDPREGFETFVHESGAIVQIDMHIQTNFDGNGLY